MDPDCLVNDRSVFERLIFKPNDVLLSLQRLEFLNINTATGLVFPRTHFLYMRAKPLQALCARHAINCERKRRTPTNLRPALASIGLGDHNYPKSFLPFFDTMHLLMAVALAEGRTLGTLAIHPDGAAHLRQRQSPYLRRSKAK